MRLILFFSLCIVLATVVSMPACKKDRDSADTRPVAQKPPFARAGDDFRVQLLSCSDRTGTAGLDGTLSSDPENNIAGYIWTKIYGPPGEIIRNANSAVASVENISPGQYVFELAVRDYTGLVARDSVVMNVTGEPTGYDIDITFNSTYLYKDSVSNCNVWYYYYGDCDTYYKSTEMLGQGMFSQLGVFAINISEQVIYDATVNFKNTFVHIYLDNINSVFISGNCNVDFASLIQQGGGSFNGTMQIDNGSALVCDPNVFATLPALSVSGNLDVATRYAVVNVKGKVFL